MFTEEPFKGMICNEELYKTKRRVPDMLIVSWVMEEDEVVEALKAPFVFVASDVVKQRSRAPKSFRNIPKGIR